MSIETEDTDMTPIVGNTYPVKDQLKALGGKWDSMQKAWMVPDDVAEQAQKLVPQSKPAPVAVNVGDLSAINALFDKARQHLKFPAIVMSVPAANMMLVRISVAGAQAKHPGTLNVTSGEKPIEELFNGRRAWYGRVMKNGDYVPANDVGDKVAKDAPNAITERLKAFAADPAGIAAEHGRLTGRCCFCNKHLQDERSTAVGYGATCASHYGLPWGKA